MSYSRWKKHNDVYVMRTKTGFLIIVKRYKANGQPFDHVLRGNTYKESTIQNAIDRLYALREAGLQVDDKPILRLEYERDGG